MFDADSRVPPELVFYASFGELFVIRVAGNVLGPSILGTLQYAGSHLKTPLFVVLGHEGCGAVDAAIASRFHQARQKSRISILLENIEPALEGLDGTLPHMTLLHQAVEANVRHTVRTLRATPEAQAREREDAAAAHLARPECLAADAHGRKDERPEHHGECGDDGQAIGEMATHRDLPIELVFQCAAGARRWQAERSGRNAAGQYGA